MSIDTPSTTGTPVDTNEIAMIAACLADSILKQLYDFANERNIFGYIGALDKISDWAHDFYDSYYSLTSDWCAFETSPANIYRADSWDEFVTEWGEERLRAFQKENS